MPENKPKPDLTELIAAQAAGTKKPHRSKAAKSVPPAPVQPQGEAMRPVAQFADKRPADLVRQLLVQRFCSAYLRLNMNASRALRAVRPELTKRHAKEMAYRLLQCDDVRTELLQQLRDLATHQDLNPAWVFDQWRAMAECSVFDFIGKIDKDGKVTEFRLDPETMTKAQRLAIRRLKFDANGRVVDFELADRSRAVENIARAQQMFRELEEESAVGLAKAIAERMQRASKLVPRVFDGETGDEIE